jgi:hypothetical protein
MDPLGGEKGSVTPYGYIQRSRRNLYRCANRYGLTLQVRISSPPASERLTLAPSPFFVSVKHCYMLLRIAMPLVTGFSFRSFMLEEERASFASMRLNI